MQEDKLMEHVERNPALQELDTLVGDWITELSNAAFLPDPSATVRGQTSFAWAQEGAILVMRQGDKPPNPPAALWLIGRDETGEEYRVFYYDNRHVSRIYRMTFASRTWKMWREAPGFCQRFQCTMAEDCQSMSGFWEKSIDYGKTWEHDFDLTYRRSA